MGMDAKIITKDGGNHLVDPGIVVSGDAGGFDSVTAHYYFGAGKPTTYVIGAKGLPLPNASDFALGSNMICMGLGEVRQLPDGPVIASVNFRGLLNATGRITSSQTAGVREREYAAIILSPGTAAVRARLIEQERGVNIKAITFVKPQVPTAALAVSSLPFSVSGTAPTQYVVSNAPKIYSVPYGWICYDWNEDEVLPGVWFVNCVFKYHHAFTYA